MKRLVTGITAGAAWLLLILYGPFPLFWLTLTMLSAIALREYLEITLSDFPLSDRTALLCFALLPVFASSTGETAPLLAGLFGALLALFLYTIFRYANLANPFALLSRGGFACLYPGLAASHLVMLMALPQGRAWLLLLSAIAAASDTAAFYTGSKFGRHKLCPAVSPAKTWEGFFGGLAGSLIAGLVVRHFFLPTESLAWLVPVTIFLAAIGAAGDLGESIIKRAFGVKDSGALLPGHGGLLDRIDSLLLSAPALYYLLYFRSMQLP